MNNLCLTPRYLKSAGFWVDCGHCRACRVKLRSSWATRIKHQLTDCAGTAVMCTLTYDNAHLPICGSVCVRAVQLFLKRLRRAIDRSEYKGTRFKYFCAAEYGSTGTCRPHYHFLFMGLDKRFERLVFDAWHKCQPVAFQFEQISSDRAITYVCGYTAKKLGVAYNEKFIKANGLRPPFQLTSIGIGKDYALRMPLIDGRYMRADGRNVVPPKYYRRLLNLGADLYRDHILDAQDDIVARVCRAYSHIKGLILDSSPPDVPSRFRFGRYLVSSLFFGCLKQIRIQVDDILFNREKDWRKFDKPITTRNTLCFT